jgi:hypothetical protein
VHNLKVKSISPCMYSVRVRARMCVIYMDNYRNNLVYLFEVDWVHYECKYIWTDYTDVTVYTHECKIFQNLDRHHVVVDLTLLPLFNLRQLLNSSLSCWTIPWF